MSPLLDKKEHRWLKERRMMKGDEGRTRAEALDQRRRRMEVFVMHFFCSDITQNVSFFCLGAWRKEKRRYVVIDRRIRRWVCL